MKRYLFLAFSFFSCLSASICEINSINDVRSYVDPDMLVVFDIDNTIMEPKQTLGSDQWFRYRIGFYEKKGYPQREAIEGALAEWMAIQNLTKVKYVEETIRDLIDSLQEEKIKVMGCTLRGLGLATRTIEQLHSLEIDLSKTAPLSEERLIMNERGVLYRNGILFTAGTHKGNAFEKLLSHLPAKTSKILVVDDKESYLKQMEEFCERNKIEFTGLRYSFLDEKVKDFSPEMVALQWEHFGNLLSDEEAQEKL